MTLIPTQIPVQSDHELTLPEDRGFFSPQTVEPSPESDDEEKRPQRRQWFQAIAVAY